ncbi:MAG TPA: hypothetical protein PKL82_01870 [Anaerolineaceae bacterium]|jgi:hypothetical protein|nr:hypothetical protein [Anaerolineaceae bacterium]NMD27894.1 hypothetical protein [Chloroflexota bacterium]HOA21218.1 hypothetical protein [Anaerolineaceae bacterium]HOG77981.1 hypothetical protein [Anaerolineaceae bacterium]
MKNKSLLVVSILLIAVLLLSACGAKNEGSSINLPAVSVAESPTAAAPQDQPANTYPAGAAQSASAAYPAGTSAGLSDADAEALLVEKLGGHHVLDWVLQFEKTRAEWEQLLSDHHGVTFTPEEKEAVITYLLNH